LDNKFNGCKNLDNISFRWVQITEDLILIVLMNKLRLPTLIKILNLLHKFYLDLTDFLREFRKIIPTHCDRFSIIHSL